MKKLFAILLVCTMMFALAATVSASKTGNSKGLVPKVTDEEIVVDGTMDTVYARGLSVYLSSMDTRSLKDTGTRGQAWMMWSDTSFYVFFSIKDADVVAVDPDMQANSPWITDNVELFFDIGNEQVLPIAQYRVDYSGYASGMQQDTDGSTVLFDFKGDAAKDYFDYAAKWLNDGYNVEMKIDMSQWSDMMEEVLEIGLQLMINDMTSEKANDRTAMFYMPAKNNPRDWAKTAYDYIVLGGMYDPEAELTQPVTEAPETEPVTTEAPETEPVTTEEPETEPEETEEPETEPVTTEEPEETEKKDDETKPVITDDAEESSFPVIPVVIAAVVVVAAVVGIVIAKKKSK